MKKIVGMVILLLVCGSIFCGTVAAAADPFGPAPSSGDGDPDGSGFYRTDSWVNDGSHGDAVGPAPNSGNGTPDGSGF